MAQIVRGRTVIIIAHRLSALRIAHRIVTIERGRILEDGTHEELIKTRGSLRDALSVSRRGCMKSAKGIARLPAWRRAGSAETRVSAGRAGDCRNAAHRRSVARTALDDRRSVRRCDRLGQSSAPSTSSVVASGKILPTGRTKSIQPFETGVVRAIYVRDGQAVKAGRRAD